MKRRALLMLSLLSAWLLFPRAVVACTITDPGCYIDNWTHKQLYELDLGIWQINRAGLVLARWIEDLRVWMTDAIFVNAFTGLIQPVKSLFYLALIAAWMVFIVSFFLQSLISVNWVDLRRVMRPIILSFILFSLGGSVVQTTETIRLVGGTVLQQAASNAVTNADIPPVPTRNTNDMPSANETVYGRATSCGTAARTQAAMFLNDYATRYLWATADDVHCNDLYALAGEFYRTYFPYGQDISGQDADVRQQAVGWAARGGLRQATGVFMTLGAVVEQLVQLMFAVALGLVWIGVLISLVFAVFVPTEEMFRSQVQALLSIVRTSWIASFAMGLGLSVLSAVAQSGNGLVVFLCGIVLIAVSFWQGLQAIGSLETAIGAASAVAGNAPQAVGGMLRGWGTTAALLGGVAMTGGLRESMTSMASSMVRRAGRNASDNPIGGAAARVLAQRVGQRIDRATATRQQVAMARTYDAETTWYEQKEYEGAGSSEADRSAQERQEYAAEQARMVRAQGLEAEAERAWKKQDFARADVLRRQANELRRGAASSGTMTPSATAQPVPVSVAPPTIPLETEAQLRRARNTALREKRFADAHQAIAQLRQLESGSPVRQRPSPATMARPVQPALPLEEAGVPMPPLVPTLDGTASEAAVASRRIPTTTRPQTAILDGAASKGAGVTHRVPTTRRTLTHIAVRSRSSRPDAPDADGARPSGRVAVTGHTQPLGRSDRPAASPASALAAHDGAGQTGQAGSPAPVPATAPVQAPSMPAGASLPRRERPVVVTGRAGESVGSSMPPMPASAPLPADQGIPQSGTGPGANRVNSEHHGSAQPTTVGRVEPVPVDLREVLDVTPVPPVPLMVAPAGAGPARSGVVLDGMVTPADPAADRPAVIGVTPSSPNRPAVVRPPASVGQPASAAGTVVQPARATPPVVQPAPAAAATVAAPPQPGTMGNVAQRDRSGATPPTTDMARGGAATTPDAAGAQTSAPAEARRSGPVRSRPWKKQG